MRRFLLAATLVASAALAMAHSPPASAEGDPTVDQIHAAAAGGHLDQAQQMITQVLAAHPNSAKAHFVQAELYAREGKAALARSEFTTAEGLKPGLPFENPRAVQELKAQLGLAARSNGPVVLQSDPAQRRFPMGTLLVLLGAGALLWMLFRRRSNSVQNNSGQYPGNRTPGMGAAPGPYGPGGYGPGPMGGGGIGSGIAGGLASGLAVGAGVVAGEELAHHFLDGGHGATGGVITPAEAGEAGLSGDNADLGGADFGMNDPGSGWDDGGGGGGGGDWS